MIKSVATPLFNTNLDAPVPLTYRELLEAYPKLLRDPIHSFQSISKTKNRSLHIVYNVDEAVPKQVDNRAEYSIVNRDIEVKLQLNTVMLENSIPSQGIK